MRKGESACSGDRVKRHRDRERSPLMWAGECMQWGEEGLEPLPGRGGWDGSFQARGAEMRLRNQQWAEVGLGAVIGLNRDTPQDRP